MFRERISCLSGELYIGTIVIYAVNYAHKLKYGQFRRPNQAARCDALGVARRVHY